MQPLPPVVEHHGAVDHEEPIGGHGRVVAARAPGVRRGGRPPRTRGSPSGRRSAAGGRPCVARASERAIAIDASRGSASAVRVDRRRAGRPMWSIRTPSPSTDHGRRGIARHERVPAPPLRSLHGLEDQAGAVARQGGEQPDGGGDVCQQLRPHGHQRPLGRERVELVTTGPRPADAVPRALLTGRYRRIRARIGGAGTEEPRTVGPGLGLAVRARDLRDAPA